MRDVWGEELKVGDLVLILNQTLYGNFINSDTPQKKHSIALSNFYTHYDIKCYNLSFTFNDYNNNKETVWVDFI